MNKRQALTFYFVVWAAVAGGVVYGVLLAGYSAGTAAASAFTLFFLVNGSLAYRGRVRQLRLEGREPPRYLQYLFFPKGAPKAKDPAPKSTHLLVGVAATVIGAFFLFCGVALAFDGNWSQVSEPLLLASSCILLSGVGIVFLYAAWQLFKFGIGSSSNVA